MTAPNHEQQPAIAHRGGVLLKAGAGSGKTYVLVEHVVYLVRTWRGEWESSDRSADFASTLADHFAASALMTFTKLAAGEIQVRLTARLEKEARDCPIEERAWWADAVTQLDRLTVTTIDGFFYKLVRRGYFPQLPPDVPIIMEGPRQKRLLALFEEWWALRAARFDEGARRNVAMHRDALADTLLEIFNNPALRDAWVGFRPADAHPSQLEWLAGELPKLESWDAFLEQDAPAVPDDSRRKNHGWVALADAIAQMPRRASTWAEVLAWADLAESPVGKTRLVLGNAKEVVGGYFEAWKDFRDSVKKWAHAFRAYDAAFEERVRPWFDVLVDLVRFIEQGLAPADGLTYGDLEFHVLRELRRPDVAARVRRDFHYFVVDEFQDTSRVQFEALQLLCDGDPAKLFCVGDAKQAIYGFRGGELAVFRDLENTPGVQTLRLSQNYRSRGGVVGFNNAFFAAIFPLGIGWEGRDPHAVEMEPQLVPESAHGPGQVLVLRADLPDVISVDPAELTKKRPTWRTSHLHRAEAAVFAAHIQERLPTIGEGRIAVLYKKLAPANALMAELIARGVGFTAQAKIPFGDDPIAGMLLVLLEDVLADHGGRWASYMVEGYLRLLGWAAVPPMGRAVARFGADLSVYGLMTAFELFLERLGVSNGLHCANLAEVRAIVELGEGQAEKVWSRLSAAADERWSADFRFGTDPEKVVLQTSHGSKGLEYEVVLVGGLATNGRSANRREWIGSLPGAALWVDDAATRRREATPQLLFERALNRQKEFAEAKRLFYVACTRAKEELVFVRFTAPEKQLTTEKGSWAAGLEAALEIVPCEERVVALTDLGQESGRTPFFHLSSLGLSAKEGGAAGTDHGITSELSITRLGALLDCPRKFYFQNILKLDEPAQGRTGGWESPEGDTEAPRELSASERGSAIHAALSHAIGHNLVLPLDWFDRPEKSVMEWALEQLRPHFDAGHQLVSEVPMKFPFFHFMVTGIPDLVVLSDASAEVWDFKTGRRKESSELRYWQQLESYALGLWELGRLAREMPIQLRLCYVDGREMVTREVTYLAVKESLFQVWSRLARLDEINLEHCPSCPYEKVCPR
jgi:ATP-dependent helicase/nuclease subunit A